MASLTRRHEPPPPADEPGSRIVHAVGAGETSVTRDGGGVAPRWRGDGRELFYLTIDGGVMAIEVDENGASSSAQPRKLFNVPGVCGNGV